MISMLLAIGMLGSSGQAAEMPYRDGDFQCIEAAKADQYARDFRVDVESFGGRELCRPESDAKKLYNDLSIIENGRFQGATANALIGGFVPANNYYNWMKSETRGMRRGNDIPFATAYNSFGYFTMQDGWSQLSTLGRVGTVLHEARHTEGYRHVVCKQGPYRDTSVDGCDQTFKEGGSHGVEMEYYARVSVQGANFHPVYQSMARLMAMARGNFVFNAPVMKEREALLAVNREGVPTLFTDGKALTREKPASEGRLKRTSFGAALFNGQHATALELYGRVADGNDIPDNYSYFKLLDRSNTRFADVEEFDVAGKRYVVGLHTDGTYSGFDFPHGDWATWKPLPVSSGELRTTTTLPNGQRGCYLVGGDGLVYPYDGETKTVGEALPDRWPAHLVRVATETSGAPLRLTDDGVIADANGAPWSFAAAGSWSDMVNVPLYDSFTVSP